ncbi:DUF4885 family protein [Schaedlerella arabinosiphila]|uniref:DUF4885 family protein n=1 Tax=Schaedlerella arabinosiphila TaxID=2044587 RepID=UPI001FA98DD5|nr:DUF4885 family protein [Schaedlerella arabinosiphila]
MPEGQSLRLTVDSCDYYIRVEGLEDKSLAESIEKVLNQGQNGFNLFTHIQRCAPSKFGYDNPSQYNSETAEKSVLYHLVKEMTGYDLRELQNEDGKFYTPDGSDLWLELKEKAEAYSPFQLEKYQEGYEKLAKTGWEGSPDYALSLEYKDQHLLDIDTEYGYGVGQTDWQEELLPNLPAEGEEEETIEGENVPQEQTEAKSIGEVSQDEKVSGKPADPNHAFPKFNPALKYAKYLKVLDEYYEKQNEENLRFANPEGHIRDKYYNPKSPYYIRGLSPLEREIGMEQEIGMLCGREPSLNGYDPVIQRTFGGCNSFQADQEYNQEMRGQINDCINQIFSANGIVIPDGTELRLTVDPYDYRIHAEGVEKDLAAEIESALNFGENGHSLYNHISYCNQSNINIGQQGSNQYVQGDKAKAAVYHMVKQLTDYDLRTLENKNGRFYTPDGSDLWEVLSNKYKEMAESGEAVSFRLEDYYDQYRRIAKEGWNRGIDAVLTIGYKNGVLFDAAV